ARALADDDGELDLPVSLRRAAGDDHRVVRSAQRRRRLGEDDRLLRRCRARLCGVVGVVQADRDEMGGARDAGTHADAGGGERKGFWVNGPDAVDDASGERRRRDVLDLARQIADLTGLVENPWLFRAPWPEP